MFKPMLAPNEKADLKSLQYPLLASYKIDGIRCIFMNGEMYSRSLKQHPNKQLADRFEILKKYSLDFHAILDGEFWARSVTFNELSGIIRQLDCALPEDLFFHCFDMVINERFDEPFSSRVAGIENSLLKGIPFVKVVDQWSVFSAEEVENLFKNALDNGFEGLILRNPAGKYKLGRGTLREGLIYKVKPFETFDSQIIDVIQATEVNEGAEKKTNALGRSVTSKKIGDRHTISKASAVVVKYNGLDLKVTLAMTDEEKTNVWEYREKYIGRMIEYKGMLVGSKDLPRHPVFIRFRDDKDNGPREDSEGEAMIQRELDSY